MTRLRLGLLATALAVLLGPTPSAHAAREFQRGNITAVDWRAMQIEIKNPKGGVETYKVAPNCSVKFTDGAADFPNPRLEDLTPPMYIHFAFENKTMLEIDVKEVGSAPRPRAQGANRAPSDRNGTDRDSSNRGGNDRNSSDRGGNDRNSSDRNGADRNSSDRQIKVRILRIDERRGTFDADVAGRRQGFRAETGRLLRGFGEGDLVILTLDRRGDLVMDIRTAGQRGRVTQIDERRGEVGIDVRGRETLYPVDDPRLLRRMRVGDRVTFEVEERRGRRVITSIE